MAGDNKLKVSADTSQIKKSLMDLSKEVKDLGKSKVSIFDKSQKDFLSKEAKKHMTDIKGQIDQNNKSILATTKLLNKEGRTLQQNVKTRQRLTNMMKKQVDLQKDLNKLSTMQTNLSGGGSGISGKLGGMLGGRGGGSMMGLGGMAKALGPAGIALAAGGGFAASRAMKANSMFRGGISDRMKLQGRGITDQNLNDPDGAAEAGLNSQSMRRSRLASMDIFGEAGSTQKAVTQRASFEKNFGLDRGAVAGMGEGMRGQLGGAGAEKATMSIQASLIASGITDEIGPYLETASTMLTTINEKGITFNDSAMGLLASLAGTEGVAAERVGKLSTNLDSAFRNSSGESNAFLQQVFGDAGIGGNTLGGIQASIRSGGLFGANTEDDALLSDEDKAMFKKTGIGGDNMSRIAGQTLKKLDSIFDIKEKNPSQEQQNNMRLRRLDFVRTTFGLSSVIKAANTEELLKSAQKGTKSASEVKKEFEKIQGGDTELANLKAINVSAAGQTQILKDMRDSLLDEAGEDLAPLFTSIDKTMMKLDATLVHLMGVFGIESADTVVEKGLGGQGVIDAGAFEQMTGGDKKKKAQMRQNLQDTIKAKEKELAGLGDAGNDFNMVRGTGDAGSFYKKKQLGGELGNLRDSQEIIGAPKRFSPGMGTGELLQRPGDSPALGPKGDAGKELNDTLNKLIPSSAKTPNTDNPMIPILREVVEVQRQTAKSSEETAKNSKRRGTAPNTTTRE